VAPRQRHLSAGWRVETTKHERQKGKNRQREKERERKRERERRIAQNASFFVIARGHFEHVSAERSLTDSCDRSMSFSCRGGAISRRSLAPRAWAARAAASFASAAAEAAEAAAAAAAAEAAEAASRLELAPAGRWTRGVSKTSTSTVAVSDKRKHEGEESVSHRGEGGGGRRRR
jgi:hypothetical protein